mgnify:CR=1 FL=1
MKIAPEYAQPTLHVLDASRVVRRRLEPARPGAASASSTRRTASCRSGCASSTPRRSGSRCCRSTEARANKRARAVRRPADAAVHRHEVGRARPRHAARVHRLAVLLPRVGAEGQVPGDPRPAGGEGALRRRAGAARRDRARRIARRRAASTATGRRAPTATTSSSRTARASRSCASSPRTATRGRTAALADYVSPDGDHVGAFAVAIHGADELAARYEAEHDDYRAIMVKALADRFAEAFAEYLHLQARREWYEPERAAAERGAAGGALPRHPAGVRLSRPAPTTPRSGSSSTCSAPRRAGLDLTESFAMTPAAAVSGIYLAQPECALLLGRPARPRPGRGLRRAEGHDHRGRPSAWLAPNLGYENRSRRSCAQPAGSEETTCVGGTMARRGDGSRCRLAGRSAILGAGWRPRNGRRPVFRPYEDHAQERHGARCDRQRQRSRGVPAGRPHADAALPPARAASAGRLAASCGPSCSGSCCVAVVVARGAAQVRRTSRRIEFLAGDQPRRRRSIVAAAKRLDLAIPGQPTIGARDRHRPAGRAARRS